MSKELEHTKQSKKGVDHINHRKVLKIVELLSKIERINSEKDSTDTEAIEYKYTSESVMRRLERNLEK